MVVIVVEIIVGVMVESVVGLMVELVVELLSTSMQATPSSVFSLSSRKLGSKMVPLGQTICCKMQTI